MGLGSWAWGCIDEILPPRKLLHTVVPFNGFRVWVAVYKGARFTPCTAGVQIPNPQVFWGFESCGPFSGIVQYYGTSAKGDHFDNVPHAIFGGGDIGLGFRVRCCGWSRNMA